MLAVTFDVHQIVDNINRTGNHAQKNKSNRDPQERFEDKKLSIEDDPGIDDYVFRPLARAHRAYQADQRFQRIVLSSGTRRNGIIPRHL